MVEHYIRMSNTACSFPTTGTFSGADCLSQIPASYPDISSVSFSLSCLNCMVLGSIFVGGEFLGILERNKEFFGRLYQCVALFGCF